MGRGRGFGRRIWPGGPGWMASELAAGSPDVASAAMPNPISWTPRSLNEPVFHVKHSLVNP
jgi:hypothetical protein